MEVEEICPKCNHETTIEETDFFVTVACEHCLEFFKVIDYEDCCKTPQLAQVRFVDGGGKNHVREQCQSCGSIKSASIGGMSQIHKSMLPLADKDRSDTTQERRYQLRTNLYQQYRDRLAKKQHNKDTLWWQQYKAYLKSQKWNEKRMLVLERDKYLCQACGKRRATQAHHLSYEFVFHEPLFELVAVCDPCHEHLHKIRNAKRSC